MAFREVPGSSAAIGPLIEKSERDWGKANVNRKDSVTTAHKKTLLDLFIMLIIRPLRCRFEGNASLFSQIDPR